jgi:hypothetical protein
VGVGIATTGTKRVKTPTRFGLGFLPVTEGLFHIRAQVSASNLVRGTSEETVAPERPVPDLDEIIEAWCTHYTPTYGQYWITWQSQSGICYQFQSIAPVFYTTNSVAIRWQNIIRYECALCDEQHWWVLSYVNYDNSYYCCSASGLGLYGSIGESQAQHKKAACSTAVEQGWLLRYSMFCTTWWN